MIPAEPSSDSSLHTVRAECPLRLTWRISPAVAARQTSNENYSTFPSLTANLNALFSSIAYILIVI